MVNIQKLTPEEKQALREQLLAEEQQNAKANKEAYEAMRSEKVTELCLGAIAHLHALSEFKRKAFSDVGSMLDLLKELGQVKRTGANVSLRTDDGKFEITYKTHKIHVFNELSKVAEEKIRQFLAEELKGLNPAVVKLVESLIDRSSSKNNELDINQIQKLYKMEEDFSNQNWKDGIRLMKESYVPSHTKAYINFYEILPSGAKKLISLDFAAIDVEQPECNAKAH